MTPDPAQLEAYLRHIVPNVRFPAGQRPGT